MSQPDTTSVIGAGTHIKGEISFETAARILGHVEGKVTSGGDLHVAEGGQCSASLEAARIIIDGSVEGDVTARERIQLNAKAVVVGDLTTTSLSVAEGASFVGYCRVGPEASRLPAPENVETRKVTPRPSANGNGNGHASAHELVNAAFAGLEAKFANINSKSRGTAESTT